MKEKIKFFDFNILNIDNLSGLTDHDLAPIDLVNCLSKSPLGFYRPQKIIWRLKIKDKDPLSYIVSKKEKHKLKKLLNRSNLSVKLSAPLDKFFFRQWYELYRQVIKTKTRGVIKISPDWLREKQTKKKFTGGIFIYEDDIFKGGSLFLEPAKTPSCLSFAYSAYLRESGNYHAYRSLAEYEFIKFGIAKGYRLLGHGRDTNLYGIHLMPGLFEFKSRYGYKPLPDNSFPIVTTFFLNKAKFQDIVLFVYYARGGQLKLAILSDKSQEEILPQRFTYPGLPITHYQISRITLTHLQSLKKIFNG